MFAYFCVFFEQVLRRDMTNNSPTCISNDPGATFAADGDLDRLSFLRLGAGTVRNVFRGKLPPGLEKLAKGMYIVSLLIIFFGMLYSGPNRRSSGCW